MPSKTFKQVCTCDNCGNEAEMEITCQWVEEEGPAPPTTGHSQPRKVKGSGTCTHCGNEADTWVDLPDPA